MTWFDTVRYGMVWCGKVWCGTVWYGMLSMLQYVCFGRYDYRNGNFACFLLWCFD